MNSFDIVMEMLSDKNDKVYAVEEGATKEAIKVIKSKEMKEASMYIKKGMVLEARNNAKAAISEFQKAKEIYTKLQDDVRKIKVGPISVVVGSTLIGVIYGLKDLSKSVDPDFLDANQLKRFKTLTSYLEVNVIPFWNLIFMVVNKLYIYSENKDAAQDKPAKVMNTMVGAVVAVLDILIDACDTHIENAEIGYNSGIVKVYGV